VLEEVLQEQMTEHLKGWLSGAHATRRGERHGRYTPNLVTPAGRIERPEVRRDREGEFVTEIFGRFYLGFQTPLCALRKLRPLGQVPSPLKASALLGLLSHVAFDGGKAHPEKVRAASLFPMPRWYTTSTTLLRRSSELASMLACCHAV